MKSRELSNLDLNKNHQLNRIAYIGMLLTSIVLLMLKDYSTATIMASLALVFDPFNPEVSFGKRPIWQNLWLISHLIFVFVAFGIEITR
ncbi:MAG: hypothetical protein KKB19_00785 [Bacteroidetes bacterium]|nr:hypothetical protein [Bacteroidota bacterium]